MVEDDVLGACEHQAALEAGHVEQHTQCWPRPSAIACVRSAAFAQGRSPVDQ